MAREKSSGPSPSWQGKGIEHYAQVGKGREGIRFNAFPRIRGLHGHVRVSPHSQIRLYDFVVCYLSESTTLWYRV